MTVSKTKKKYTFDVGWVFASSIIVLLLHFIQKPILARYLGPDGLGLFTMAIMIVGIIELIATFGIDGALTRYVAMSKENKEAVSSLVSSALITILIFGMLTSIALFLCSNTLANLFDMPLLDSLLKIYAFAFTFSILLAVIIGFFRGLREMKYYSFIRILQASLALTFISVLLMIGFGAEGAMLGIVLTFIASFGVAIVTVKRFVRFTVSDYKKNTRMLASFGSRLIGVNMIGQIYYYIDILMIGYFLTSTDVGYYAIAISLSRFFWLVPSAMGSVSYPAISEYWAKDNHQAINKMVDKSTKYSACLLIFAGMSVVFFAKDIISIVFTSVFLPAVLPLTILIIGTVTSGVLRSVDGLFAGTGKVNLVLKISSIGTVMAILLNIALIPTYGIIGAAIATTATYILRTAISLHFMRKVLAIKLDAAWFTKMAMLVGTSGALFYTLGFLNHYASSAVVLSVYAIVVIKYLLTKEDRDYVVNIAKQVMQGDFIR